MKTINLICVILFLLNTNTANAKTFLLVGKALVCTDGRIGDQNLDDLPSVSAEGIVVGAIFKFHEDSVEVYTDWETGYQKSTVQPHYKETGRHLIWIESAYVEPKDRGRSFPVITRKHTLNRFVFTKTYIFKTKNINGDEGDRSPSQDAASSCRLTTHVWADKKVEELRVDTP